MTFSYSQRQRSCSGTEQVAALCWKQQHCWLHVGVKRKTHSSTFWRADTKNLTFSTGAFGRWTCAAENSQSLYTLYCTLSACKLLDLTLSLCDTDTKCCYCTPGVWLASYTYSPCCNKAICFNNILIFFWSNITPKYCTWLLWGRHMAKRMTANRTTNHWWSLCSLAR